MAKYVDADKLWQKLPDELPYKASVKRVLMCAEEADVVEVVHGEWKPYSTTMMECSVCKRHTARHRYEFCPHCGAKMDAKERGGEK